MGGDECARPARWRGWLTSSDEERHQLHEVVKKKTAIYHAFNQALEFETDGHDLYMDLAKKVKNPKIKAFQRRVRRKESLK